jgi:hypothetical protein
MNFIVNLFRLAEGQTSSGALPSERRILDLDLDDDTSITSGR